MYLLNPIPSFFRVTNSKTYLFLSNVEKWKNIGFFFGKPMFFRNTPYMVIIYWFSYHLMSIGFSRHPTMVVRITKHWHVSALNGSGHSPQWFQFDADWLLSICFDVLTSKTWKPIRFLKLTIKSSWNSILNNYTFIYLQGTDPKTERNTLVSIWCLANEVQTSSLNKRCRRCSL